MTTRTATKTKPEQNAPGLPGALIKEIEMGIMVAIYLCNVAGDVCGWNVEVLEEFDYCNFAVEVMEMSLPKGTPFYCFELGDK